MKDIFVFIEVFAGEGGIQSYVKDILRAYISLASQSGLTAEVLILRDPAMSPNPFEGNGCMDFHYCKTDPRWLSRIRLAIALLGSILWERPRRVFCGHINLAPLVELFCKPLGIPYIVLTYGKEVWEPLTPRYQRALKDAASVWTISRYSRDRARKANGLNPSVFQFLPCAVDGDAFTPGPKSQALVEKYNLAGSRVLMTVARLWSGDIYKGVDVTIRALPKVVQVFPEVKYLVIGRGDDRPRLEKLARDLGVGDRVIFAGFVPTEELVDHYRLADAYIMPSQEGFGIVYLEAMACRVPVLAGDGDGSADPLQDGRLGWQVPHRDPEAVAAACIQILKGGDIRCDGEWLRQEAIGAFGKGAFTKGLAELLDLNKSG
ncbi:MAG: glycosyltransferase [Hormoscilla sp.]